MTQRVSYAEVQSYIDQRAKDYGVDPATARAFLYAENVGKNGELPEFLSTSTVSPKGAIGPMQVMPNTYANLVKQNYLQPGSSLEAGGWQHQTDAGIAAIAEMQRRAGTDPKLLAAHYNGGTIGLTLAKAGKFDALLPETQRYLRNVETALGTSTTPTSPVADAAASSVNQGDLRRLESGVGAPGIAAPATGGATLRAGADGINGIVANYSTMLNDLIKTFTSSREEQAAALRNSAAAITAEGTALAEKRVADDMVVAATTQLRERLLKQFSLDSKDLDSLVARTLTEQRQLQMDRAPLSKEIDARMSVGFFDDPLQWLINQTVLPGQVNQHNAMVRRENELGRQLNFAQNTMANQEKIDIAADLDLLAKQTTAAMKVDAARTQAKLAAVEEKTAGLAAQTALQISHAVGTAATVETVNLQRSLALAQKAAAADATAREQEILRTTNERLRVVGDSIGAPGVNLQTLKGRGQKAMDEWQKRANTGKLGDNLAEALTFISDYGNLDVMAATGKAEQVKFLRGIITATNNKVDLDLATWAQTHPGTKVPTREELRNMTLRNTENAWRQAVVADMGQADKLNPYRIDHAVLVKDFKGSENNQVFLMAKQALAQGVEVDDRQILLAAQDAVRAGQMDPRAIAAQLTEYYKMGVGRNNAARSFTLLGMEAQSTYVMKPKGAETGVNLLDQTAVENLMIKSAASNFNPALLGLMGSGWAAGVVAYPAAKSAAKGAVKILSDVLPGAKRSNLSLVPSAPGGTAPDTNTEMGVAP